MLIGDLIGAGLGDSVNIEFFTNKERKIKVFVIDIGLNSKFRILNNYERIIKVKVERTYFMDRICEIIF